MGSMKSTPMQTLYSPTAPTVIKQKTRPPVRTQTSIMTKLHLRFTQLPTTLESQWILPSPIEHRTHGSLTLVHPGSTTIRRTRSSPVSFRAYPKTLTCCTDTLTYVGAGFIPAPTRPEGFPYKIIGFRIGFNIRRRHVDGTDYSKKRTTLNI
jgi:hypothetical protein